MRQAGKPQHGPSNCWTCPGNPLVDRLGAGAPGGCSPNVLTALVTAMSIALVAVLLCWRPTCASASLTPERNLGEALAFRKAMEDSLESRACAARDPRVAPPS